MKQSIGALNDRSMIVEMLLNITLQHMHVGMTLFKGLR
jgi:hypothetical protein